MGGYSKMKEKDIEQRLRKSVKELGGIAYKFISPGNMGVPDRMVCLPGGVLIFVELKTEIGTLTPVQKAQIGYLKNLGQDVRVLYGLADVERFIAELRGLGDPVRQG